MTTATQEEAIILFPLGKKEWGWLYHQEAFETIMRQIAEVKSRYNINDNKIYLGGHSNGGTGAFWFANKKPSAFAGFFAYNFLPVLYSSNTHLNNLLWGPPLYGMHGLRDKTFPATETSQIHLLAQRNGAVWHSTYLQEGHSLPFSGNDSTRALFDSVKFHSRTPFREKLFWETDDVRNGRNHWIEISELDTTSARAPWHIDLIPEIISSKKYQKYPFNRNKTGAIRASLAERNVVHLESSRVKKAKLYFSEDMFDFSKRVKIYHEGVLIFNSKIRANKNTILSEFLKTYDRSYIVSHILEIELAGI